MSSIVWPRKTMLLNALLFWPMVLLGGYVLWNQSALMFWVYVAIWLGIIVLGRYFVCRRCKYYGVNCPSFGYSYLVRIFKKDESRSFSGRAVHSDSAATMLVMLLPILAWIFGAAGVVVSGYGAVDHMLSGVYAALVLLMLGTHSLTGCSKCDLAQCCMSRAARERKSQL